MKTKRYTKEEFQQAVTASRSIHETLKTLGLNPFGSAYQTFHKASKEWEIDTSHFSGRRWLGRRPLGVRRPIEDYFGNKVSINSANLRDRLIKEGFKERMCERCKLDTWMDEPMPLELHHKNGEHKDNTLENLEILCANCHGIETKKQFKENANPIPGHRRSNNKCVDCNKGISTYCTRCKSCDKKLQPLKIQWPSKEEVIKRLETSNYSKLGRELGVSDNAIRKYLNR